MVTKGQPIPGEYIDPATGYGYTTTQPEMGWRLVRPLAVQRIDVGMRRRQEEVARQARRAAEQRAIQESARRAAEEATKQRAAEQASRRQAEQARATEASREALKVKEQTAEMRGRAAAVATLATAPGIGTRRVPGARVPARIVPRPGAPPPPPPREEARPLSAEELAEQRRKAGQALLGVVKKDPEIKKVEKQLIFEEERKKVPEVKVPFSEVTEAGRALAAQIPTQIKAGRPAPGQIEEFIKGGIEYTAATPQAFLETPKAAISLTVPSEREKIAAGISEQITYSPERVVGGVATTAIVGYGIGKGISVAKQRIAPTERPTLTLEKGYMTTERIGGEEFLRTETGAVIKVQRTFRDPQTYAARVETFMKPADITKGISKVTYGEVVRGKVPTTKTALALTEAKAMPGEAARFYGLGKVFGKVTDKPPTAAFVGVTKDARTLTAGITERGVPRFGVTVIEQPGRVPTAFKPAVVTAGAEQAKAATQALARELGKPRPVSAVPTAAFTPVRAVAAPKVDEVAAREFIAPTQKVERAKLVTPTRVAPQVTKPAQMQKEFREAFRGSGMARMPARAREVVPAQVQAFKQTQTQVQKQMKKQTQKQMKSVMQTQKQATPAIAAGMFGLGAPTPITPTPFPIEERKRPKRPRPPKLWDYGVKIHPVAKPKEMLRRFLGGSK